MRRERGFTLIEILVVISLLAMLLAVAVPCLLRSQMAARQASACGLLKSLVGNEAIWHAQDFDRNGVADYWVRDVQGMHSLVDAGGNAVALVSRSVAQADRSPAFAYPVSPGTLVSSQGYFVQAMAKDQGGQPYVDPLLPPPTAAPAAVSCTNRGRYGFTAFPETYGRDGVSVYVVSEDGVIWEKSDGDGARVLDRAQVKADALWRPAGS